jgi:hypothetical protein
MKWLLAVVPVLAPLAAYSQVIEYEANGLKYQSLSRSGVTIIFSHLPAPVSEYSIIQVSISNGSDAPYTIRPEDFWFLRGEGQTVRAAPSKEVVAVLSRKGSGGDMIKLVQTYEASVYSNAHIRSTNGYEQRRLGALAMSSNKLRAAATASALALVQTKLEDATGQADGAHQYRYLRVSARLNLLQGIVFDQFECPLPAGLAKKVGNHVDNVIDSDVGVG